MGRKLDLRCQRSVGQCQCGHRRECSEDACSFEGEEWNWEEA
jgi:hypothetical protein